MSVAICFVADNRSDASLKNAYTGIDTALTALLFEQPIALYFFDSSIWLLTNQTFIEKLEKLNQFSEIPINLVTSASTPTEKSGPVQNLKLLNSSTFNAHTSACRHLLSF